MNRKRKKDNRGMSLAELIVTFALMGIFLAAVAVVISSSVLIHSELTGTMYAQSVSETLIDKIAGELAAADPVGSKAIVVGRTLKEGEDIGGGVSFYDREGNKASFYVEDGLLVMKADENWKMDEKAYMGYRITEMKISRLNKENVLEIVLTIRNLKTDFTYTASRAVACYNFESEKDFEKIREEDILLE